MLDLVYLTEQYKQSMAATFQVRVIIVFLIVVQVSFLTNLVVNCILVIPQSGLKTSRDPRKGYLSTYDEYVANVTVAPEERHFGTVSFDANCSDGYASQIWEEGTLSLIIRRTNKLMKKLLQVFSVPDKEMSPFLDINTGGTLKEALFGTFKNFMPPSLVWPPSGSIPDEPDYKEGNEGQQESRATMSAEAREALHQHYVEEVLKEVNNEGNEEGNESSELDDDSGSESDGDTDEGDGIEDGLPVTSDDVSYEVNTAMKKLLAVASMEQEEAIASNLQLECLCKG